MGLKQIPPIKRIVFLRKLTQEILYNINKEQTTKKAIEIEKLKRKFIQPLEVRESRFINLPIKNYQKSRGIKNQQYLKNNQRNLRRPIPKPPILQRNLAIPRRNPIMPPNQFQKPIQNKTQEAKTPEQIVKEIKPVSEKKPESFNLGKLENLLKDPKIQSIECRGPNKPLLVKIRGRINHTGFNLSKEEIKNIIEKFSKESKIPIANGILKTAVGDLIISAIISDFVGSRFIINRL